MGVYFRIFRIRWSLKQMGQKIAKMAHKEFKSKRLENEGVHETYQIVNMANWIQSCGTFWRFQKKLICSGGFESNDDVFKHVS